MFAQLNAGSSYASGAGYGTATTTSSLPSWQPDLNGWRARMGFGALPQPIQMPAEQIEGVTAIAGWPIGDNLERIDVTVAPVYDSSSSTLRIRDVGSGKSPALEFSDEGEIVDSE